VSPADLSDHERDRHVQMRIQPNCESGRELTTRLVGGVRKKSSSRQLGFGKRASLTPKGGSVSSGASGAGAGDAMSPSRCRCREVLGLVDLERELLRRFPEQGSEKTRVMSPDVQDHVVAVLSEHVEECTQTLEIIMAEEAPAPREGGIRGLLKGGWKIGGSKEERRTRKAEKAAAVLYGVANPLRT
jgi:ribosomal protein L25 (general stress protein Ctc)